MKIKDLLPIGSVVLLKDGEKRLMIFGVMQTEMEQDGKDYDYIGVLYPEGYIGEQFQYLFNHEDIEKIIFQGYQDEERNSFINKLADYYGE